MVIDIVGGSIGVDSKGLFKDGSHIVSDTDVLVNPATQTMSPALTSLTAILLLPSKPNSFVNLPFSTTFPSRFIDLTVSLILILPLSTFPIKHLPR